MAPPISPQQGTPAGAAMRSALTNAILLLVVPVLISCTAAARPSTPTQTPTSTSSAMSRSPVFVSRDTMGKDWPFTIASGTVRCVPYHEVVMVGSDGYNYAINGSARGDTRMPWRDGVDILRKGKLPYDMQPLIDLGLSLCLE